MNQELLCTWLGLPKTAWPPDPWTLVGLARGEHDEAAIEERVHERMTKLRHYQLTYPEEATEGMNRLAEAFVTLTEACTKKSKAPTETKPAPAAVISKDETSVIDGTKVDWRNEPPPVRQEPTPAQLEPASSPEVIVEVGTPTDEVLVARPFVAPAKPHRREVDLALMRELAEESDEATSKVGTIDAVVARVDTTRRLLHAWEKIGKYLRTTKKTTPRDAENFAKRLETIAEVMHTYPAFLGHPGKPGYRVVVLARLKIPLPIVRAMTPDQRDDLLFDWQAGYHALLLHRKFLRKLFRSMRHRSTIGLVLYAMRAALNDYPRLTLIGILLLVALGVAGALKLAL